MGGSAVIVAEVVPAAALGRVPRRALGLASGPGWSALGAVGGRRWGSPWRGAGVWSGADFVGDGSVGQRADSINDVPLSEPMIGGFGELWKADVLDRKRK